MYDNIIPIQEELIEKKKDYALVNVIKTSGSSIARPGFKIIVSENRVIYGTLGSPNLDRVIMGESMEAIKKKSTKYLKIALDKDNKDCDYSMNTTCGGIIELFIEPYIQRCDLIILHESDNDMLLKSILYLSDYIGMNITTIDINNDERKKYVFSSNFDGDYILMLTKSEKEIDFIEYLAGQKVRYIAIVSSKNRFNSDIQQLKKRNNKLDYSKIKCPAGIDINAISINEIAISIISEIIKEKNKAQNTDSS
ncbi:MAG: XdhC family protein [Ferroplasma sp.]